MKKWDLFLADLWEEGGYWKYTPMLRNGISFVTFSGKEHQLTGSETVWKVRDVHHCVKKKKKKKPVQKDTQENMEKGTESPGP